MYDPLFSTPRATNLFADPEFFRCMLRFEVALARALEVSQEIPPGCAKALEAIDVELLDLSQIAVEAASAGNLCIPFIKALTTAVRQKDAVAAGYVHWARRART